MGELATPVPERTAVCGLPVALSLTLNAAVRVPAAAGTNVTLTVHVLPDVSVELQLLVSVKSVELAPVIEIETCVKLELPELLRTIACEVLLEPTT